MARPTSTALASARGALILNLDGNARVVDIDRVFGPSRPDWQHDLGFVVKISPLEDTDARIRRLLEGAFALAKRYDLRLLVHINNEYLFGGCPSDCQPGEGDYARARVREITGVQTIFDGSRRNFARVDSSPEVLQRVEWISWTTPQDSHLLYWGDPPAEIAPRINFESTWIRARLADRAEVVNTVLREIFDDPEYFPQTDSRFVGLDVGWETAIEDQDNDVQLGFGALNTLGYSAESSLSADDVHGILSQSAFDFVEHLAAIYGGVVRPAKLFSHYALYTADYRSTNKPYRAALRHPAERAHEHDIVPGLGLYLCGGGHCDDDYIADMREAIGGGGDWAVTETTTRQAGALIHGFPANGVPAPLFVVAYNFGAAEAEGRNPDGVDQLMDALLTAAPAEPDQELQGELEGIGTDGTVHGWACDPNTPESGTPVGIYVARNPFRSVVADLESESWINIRCGGGTHHRFSYTPTPPELAILDDGPVVAWAQNDLGDWETLDGSPRRFVRPPDRALRGRFEGIATNGRVYGWACDPDTPDSGTPIGVFVNGSPWKSLIADQVSGGPVNELCGGGTHHRFSYTPTAAELATLGDGPVVVWAQNNLHEWEVLFPSPRRL